MFNRPPTDVAREDHGPPRGFAVLLVEDDPELRDVLAAAVQAAGYEALTAGDGREALAVLRGARPVDLIILDLWMPGMNGWEFRLEQRRDPALRAIPVVVLSADTSERGLTLDADAFLPKPVELDDFRAMLERFRGSSRETSPTAASVALPARVLVIDDDPLIGSMIRRILAVDRAVTTTATPREALARLGAGEVFDLVLCDLMMPEMSGLEFHAALAGVAPASLPRVVILTGGAYSARIAASLTERSVPTLEKPFDPRRLRQFVRDRLREVR